MRGGAGKMDANFGLLEVYQKFDMGVHFLQENACEIFHDDAISQPP
jgi:hypothetical protein